MIDLLSTYDPAETFAISVVTLTELQEGVSRSHDARVRHRRAALLDEVRASVEVAPVTLDIALRAGDLSAFLILQGTRLPLGDLLIAATALVRGDAVMTQNVEHFRRVPHLDVVASPHLRVP